MKPCQNLKSTKGKMVLELKSNKKVKLYQTRWNHNEYCRATIGLNRTKIRQFRKGETISKLKNDDRIGSCQKMEY